MDGRARTHVYTHDISPSPYTMHLHCAPPSSTTTRKGAQKQLLPYLSHSPASTHLLILCFPTYQSIPPSPSPTHISRSPRNSVAMFFYLPLDTFFFSCPPPFFFLHLRPPHHQTSHHSISPPNKMLLKSPVALFQFPVVTTSTTHPTTHTHNPYPHLKIVFI